MQILDVVPMLRFQVAKLVAVGFFEGLDLQAVAFVQGLRMYLQLLSMAFLLHHLSIFELLKGAVLLFMVHGRLLLELCLKLPLLRQEGLLVDR